MKKLFISMLAAITLFASCSEEDVVSQTTGQSVVSFKVTTPELVSRAIGDGTTAKNLYYAVYDGNSEIVSTISKTGTEAVTLTDKEAEVKLPLLNGETYSILFWAQASDETMSTIDWQSKSITINPQTSNKESYDAFSAYVEPFVVTGTQTKEIKLYRPFAQLNIGTTDGDLLNATQYYFGLSTTANLYTQSKIVVTIPTKMDLTNGFVSDEKKVTYDVADFLTNKLKNEYDYLSMNYLLVPNEKSIIDVELSCYAPTKSSETAAYITKKFENVPVQRNYKTNIYGALFTSSTTWNVELVPDFNTPDNELVPYTVSTFQELNNAASTGALITLKNDIEVTSQISFSNNVEINGYGYTIKGSPLVFTGQSVIIKNTKFAGSSADNNSYLLAHEGNKVFTIDNCEFDTPKYEAIQYTSQNAEEVTINNCIFKTSNASTARAIHLELRNDDGYYAGNGIATITNNKFFNGDNYNYNNDKDIVCVLGFGKDNLTIKDNVVYDVTSLSTDYIWICNGKNLAQLRKVIDEEFKVGGTSIATGTDVTTTTQSIITALNTQNAAVTLSENITTNSTIGVAAGNLFDGAGYELTTEKTIAQYMIQPTGGTIQNMVITGYNERNENANVLRGILISNPTESVTINGVKVSGVAYSLNTSISSNYSMPANCNLSVSNSTLIGWASWDKFANATFTNCHFGIGNYFDATYDSSWNGCIRPYVTTTFENCTFDAGFVMWVDKLADSASLIFKNCKVGSEPITQNNIENLLGFEKGSIAITVQ